MDIKNKKHETGRLPWRSGPAAGPEHASRHWEKADFLDKIQAKLKLASEKEGRENHKNQSMFTAMAGMKNQQILSG